MVAALQRGSLMDVPIRWRDYDCEEYFRNGWSESGHLSEESQTWVIVRLADAYEDAENEFFAIGRSGCDGIDLGFRKGKAVLWALYPIDQDFKLMASTISDLVEGWCSSRLAV